MNYLVASIITTVVTILPVVITDSHRATVVPIEQPSCDTLASDGSYPALVCKGEEPDGRCFCCGGTGAERKRIFGWSWSSFAKNITCACSGEMRERLERRNDVSLHCMENGNYDKLQCDNGLCWCVVPTSGEPTERLYPESMMRHLPCSDLEKDSRQRQYYQRQCESKALARISVLRKLVAHGTLNTHIDEPLCDYDGSYATRQFSNKLVNCVWKSGKKIDNYQSSVANFSTTNCYCARDTVIYADENMDFSMSCGGNGNYDRSQTSNGKPYCVDSDGYPTTGLGDIGETLNCGA